MAYHTNRFLGLMSITLGLIIVFLTIGSILIRCAIALCGLMLINHGLRLYGSMPLQYRAYNWFSRTHYRG